jgi:L-threonylcarbamoyladenylate synthase
MDSHIDKAVKVLTDGGIVIFPTDTAFGIGCRMDRRDSVDRLFALRKRPITQATPVLVSSVEMALQYYVHPDDTVKRLMKTYWPGAVTIVAPCDISRVYEMVRGGTETLGLRMPNNKNLLEIITRVGIPILGPSANFHGELTPFSLNEVHPELKRSVDYVLPGICTLKQPSTVVSVEHGTISIIRDGAINVI